ncbi:MAG: hypothetical protein GTO51_06660 [Candidatus Latescibacteria bacterium]|nr:hypothetical protein [Candidatus Latescibacterota bacterium]NIM21484.1 hypothetical protein [Candidatus Latescibacterota bacterium]NIM65655.1 hypothetical protein [Candidatus Latescibacterota bacterium]NIO02037.1 hypothetical protein [Candidatus Latescibacterota bacterium]NIO28849.1 hypothetical protein [Candidatus Latescibacterota bacterium]
MGLRQKLIAASIIVLATLIGIIFSLILLKSEKAAIGLYVVSFSLIMIIVEPYIGMLNYLLFLYLRPQEFISAFRTIPVMFLVGGVTLVIMLIRMAMDRKPFAKAPQSFFMFWLFVAIIVSQLAQFYMAGAMESANYFLSILFMYTFMVNLITTEKKLRITIYVLIVLTMYLAITGIYQYFTGEVFGITVLEDRRIRGMGIFNDPNDLALALLIAMPFIVLPLLGKSRGRVKIALIPITASLIYALYLTNSRGGFLGLAALLSVVFFKRYGKKAGAMLTLATLAAILLLGPSRTMEMSAREESAYGRVEAWAAGMDMFKSNMLFGVGIGNYTDYHPLVAHNSFVHCAAELGLFGLFPWVMLIYISMKNIYFVTRNAGTSHGTQIWTMNQATLYAFVAFVVTTTFLSRAYNELLYILIALSAASVNVFVSQSSDEYCLIEKKDFMYVFFIIVASLIGLQLFLLWYW